MRVEAKLKNYDKIMDYVDEKLEQMDCPSKAILKINVACDEIIANITSYAYKDGTGDMSVEVNQLDEPRGVEITFTDNGVPFNPLDIEDPNVEEAVEKRKVGGLGIYMIKNTMDEVKYNYSNNSNNLTIIKYF